MILLIMGCVSLFNRSQFLTLQDTMGLQNHEKSKQQLVMELKVKMNELETIKSTVIITKNTELAPKFNDVKTKIEELIKQISQTASSQQETNMIAQITENTNEYTTTFEAVTRILKSNSLSSQDKEHALESNFNLSQIHKEYFFQMMDKFYAIYSNSAEQAQLTAEHTVNEAIYFAMLAFILVIVVSSGITFLHIRSFMRPIQRLQAAVKRIAQGDLTHRINNDSKDELGDLSRSFDLMIDQVRSMLNHTQVIASSLAGHAQTFHHFSQSTASANADIVRAIQAISVGTDEQAQHTETTSLTITDLQQDIHNMTEYALDMQQKSYSAIQTTEQGSQSAEHLQQSTQQAKQILQQIIAVMETLHTSSTQIEVIVNTIQNVSTQTQILSLNAAIEASRAGQQGRGFSIIAEEVRMLSMQTKDSSQTIVDIIQNLQQQITELSQTLTDADRISNIQQNHVHDSLQSFHAIQQVMLGMSQQIDQMQQRTQDIRMKNTSIVDAIVQVAGIAQQTAAGVEEVNSTSCEQDSAIRHIAKQAEDISSLSVQLFDEINKFTIVESNHRKEAAD